MGHWKKPFKSDHLSSSDIEGKDLVLTIECVKQEICKSQAGDELANVAYFTDKKYKPMRLNVGNSTLVKKFSGYKQDTDDWKMIPVTVYVNPNVRFGRETVEGLRIRPVQPKITPTGEVKKTPLTPKSSNWNDIVGWVKSGGALESVTKKYSMTKEDLETFNTLTKKDEN